MAPDALELVFPRRNEKCTIYFSDQLISRVPLELFSGVSSVAIVSDDIVSKLYSKQLEERLSETAKTHMIVIRHGERNKNLTTVSSVANQMSDHGLDRKSALIALGGGVVGDLAGFVASIFKRGIKYFQFPTTLLAQVDSSIGGKCAVDTKWGKNQLGSFYQPEGIFIDESVLTSLPKKELINGLGEIMKSSIIADPTMFGELESLPAKYFEMQDLRKFVRRTCEIKASIVEKDETEINLRKTLNYGHTLGHAIESASRYRLSHGKSVILGMICEAWIAYELGILEKNDFERQTDLLLKTKNHFRITPRISKKEVLAFALLDKKNTSGVIQMSLPEKIGKMHAGKNELFTSLVSKDLVARSLEKLN
jgi:3-dehydroquinate synthase